MHVDVLRTAQEKLACLRQNAVGVITARIKTRFRLGNTDARYRRRGSKIPDAQSRNPACRQGSSLATTLDGRIGEGEDSDGQEFPTAAGSQEETSMDDNESSPMDRDDVHDDLLLASVHSKRVSTSPAPFFMRSL